jgi:hypothetical protein
MAVKDCSGYMSDDTAYNMKAIDKSRQGKSDQSKKVETDYSIKSKQMPENCGW